MFDRTYTFESNRTRIAVGLKLDGELENLIADTRQGDFPRQVVLITDSHVGPLYELRVAESLQQSGCELAAYQIPAGESSKCLRIADDLYQFLAKAELGRDGLILALGGGVVSDLAGFVAATWMRGVDFAIFPTTIEAAVDAAIGGKTAINIAAGKNLVGAFHQPCLVAVDTTFLNTLSRRDLRAGIAESIKHALIASEDLLAFHEDNAEAILACDSEVMADLIGRNIGIKADIVQQDALETSGIRVFLNFGHTIGHAIELCANYELRHGECVALGMRAACLLSIQLAELSSDVLERLDGLLERFALPTKLEKRIDPSRILNAIAHDKKSRRKRPQFVLLSEIGQPVLNGDLGDEMIRSAYGALLP